MPEDDEYLNRICKYDPKSDHYDTLGVSPSVSEEKIKEIFRKLAKIYHPDCPDEKQTAEDRNQAEVKFKNLNNAYEVLADVKKRRLYDENRLKIKKENERERAEEKDRRDKEAKYARIQDLFEKGDVEGAVREAKNLYACFPGDADCQNNYAALLHEWAKRLAEKGKLKEATVQLKEAAKHTLDDELKARIRADLELLQSKGADVPPSRTPPKSTASAPPPRSPPKPPIPPSPPPKATTPTTTPKHSSVGIYLVVAAVILVAILLFTMRNQGQNGNVLPQGQWLDIAMQGGVASTDNREISGASTSQTVLFSDNFNGNSIAPTKWMVSGNSVIQANQTMEVLTTVMDAGGNLTSVPFAVANTGLITITRQVFLHHNDAVYFKGQNHFFNGSFSIKVGSVPTFSIQYADMDYSDLSTYMARYGFFMTRNDSSVIAKSSQPNVSPAISPLWDKWFNEKITYDPVGGIMEYFINNVSQGTFHVGALPETDLPTMTLHFNAWGWYTGHGQLIRNLTVSQATNVQ